MGCMRKYDMLLYDNGNKGIYITKAFLYKTPQRFLQNASVIQVASIIPNTTALGLQTRVFGAFTVAKIIVYNVYNIPEGVNQSDLELLNRYFLSSSV